MCRRLPLYCLLDQLKIKASVDQSFAEAKRTQKFKRGDIDIFAVAGIEDDFLRVTFGIAHAQVIAEVFIHARYLIRRSRGHLHPKTRKERACLGTPIAAVLNNL